MFDVFSCEIPGVFEIRPIVRSDIRGNFVKIFHKDVFAEHGLILDFAEMYHTTSQPGVVRGLHFQTPPHDYVKLVGCVAGSVFDAVVDLRRGSPTFGQHQVFRLSQSEGNLLYLPSGIAHGFCVEAKDDPATMFYVTSAVYAPDHDGGIAWDSAGIAWPVTNPLLSDRDRALPRMADFDSPFVHHPAA